MQGEPDELKAAGLHLLQGPGCLQSDFSPRYVVLLLLLQLLVVNSGLACSPASPCWSSLKWGWSRRRATRPSFVALAGLPHPELSGHRIPAPASRISQWRRRSSDSSLVGTGGGRGIQREGEEKKRRKSTGLKGRRRENEKKVASWEEWRGEGGLEGKGRKKKGGGRMGDGSQRKRR